MAFANKGARLLSWKLEHYRDGAAGPRRWCWRSGRDRSPWSWRPATRRWTRACARRSSGRPRSTWCCGTGAANELRFEWVGRRARGTQGPAFPSRGTRESRPVRRGGQDLPGRAVWAPEWATRPRPRRRCRVLPPSTQGVYLGPDGVRPPPAREDLRPSCPAGCALDGVEGDTSWPCGCLPRGSCPRSWGGRSPGWKREDGAGVAAAVGVSPASGPARLYVGPRTTRSSPCGERPTARGRRGGLVGPIVVRSWPCCAGLFGHGQLGWAITCSPDSSTWMPRPAIQHRQRPEDGQAIPGDAASRALPEGPHPRPEAAGDAAGDRRAVRPPRHEHGHPDGGGLPAPSCSPCRS